MFKVIFGGGRQCLISDVKSQQDDPTDTWACYSKDGRNLIHEWERDKQYRGVSHSFVENRLELLNLDVENNDFILGKQNKPFYKKIIFVLATL